MVNTEKEVGKYCIHYSSGASKILTGVIEKKAKEEARKEKETDKGVTLVKITKDDGGVVIRL